ncbi:hypothetical protein D9619_007892 [Psilocybe cf. subviscida]|uniref:RRM domain-containing protein n=1 Tax=Psilocybe cf. subviscida TaxID=2480587 RepID=A0A8H5EST1_9AGAR|nr:hypothetical protein D9619_007892 [Psilocybe cf. subviscida]
MIQLFCPPPCSTSGIVERSPTVDDGCCISLPLTSKMDPNANSYQEGPRPHPYIEEPRLFISNLPPFVSDQDLAKALTAVSPFKPNLQRDGSPNPVSGEILFRYVGTADTRYNQAEKAYTICNGRNIPELSVPVPLVLSPFPPMDPPTMMAPPQAMPRLVKQLPPNFSDSQLYDLFRPFGPLASAHTQTQYGPDIGMVEFWHEEDAIHAQDELHCSEVEGQNITVQVFQPKRIVPEFNLAAPAFVPSGVMFSLRLTLDQEREALAASLIPAICSANARVMRNEAGESRGFGFVSYHQPEQANEALRAMNNSYLGSKQIVVRLHEPKQLRQEKLAQRFAGHNAHPRRASSGATSPAASEAGDYSGWNSPRTFSQPLGSPALSPKAPHHLERTETKERGRRGSGSYYQAALNGTINMSINYNSLSQLSPVVRKEVLSGELSRRVKELDELNDKGIEALVDSLVGLSISNVLHYLDDPEKLKQQVDQYKEKHPKTPVETPAESPSRSVSESPSQDSRLVVDPATASAPEHPSTPLSLLTPPRAASPAGSMPPVSERDRVFAAVCKLESTMQSELTDLIMSLPKRERAMCLFNTEHLRLKLVDAKMVLESDGGDDAPVEAAPAPPVTPQARRTAAPSSQLANTASPQTPDLSSRGPSATASPTPATPSTAATGSGSVHTLASLAKLPAGEIVRLASSSSATGLPLPKADPLIIQATDSFVDGLMDKPPQTQKQLLGEKLFKVVKSLGVKGAPKITIALLDQEDLRGLAHLMNSYQPVLKEKAIALSQSNLKHLLNFAQPVDAARNTAVPNREGAPMRRDSQQRASSIIVMSYKRAGLYPPNPVTARGVSTKLSSAKDKIVYTSGRTVLIRDLKNPGLTVSYSGHIQNATVARLSPSGYYCASADVTGQVRVWDTVGEDQVSKGEYKVISGRVNDLAWDGESKRIIAVGDGKEKCVQLDSSSAGLPTDAYARVISRFGYAFMMDTGSSVGGILGHSKAINAVSIRHQRPFKAATAGDDGAIIFHSGAPYKYEKVGHTCIFQDDGETIKTHTKFVQDVQYAPSGDHFASVGSDFKAFLYDGQTGDTVAEFTDSPHKGSITTDKIYILDGLYMEPRQHVALDFVSGLYWDAQTQNATTTWTLGSGVNHQQVGNTWTADNNIVSLSMSGDLNIFDARTPDKPVSILSAPQISVTAVAPSSPSTFIAGTTDGRVYSYDSATFASTSLSGEGHSNNVSGLASGDGKVYSIGYDDRVREIDVNGQQFVPASATTSSQPKSIAVAGDSTVFVAELGVVEAFRANQKVFETKPSYEPGAVAASGSLIAIGGDDRKVRLNEWDGKALKEVAVLEGNQGAVSALAFSPDGKYLISGDSSGKLVLFDPAERKLVTSRWAHHSARVNSLSWTADSAHCASGSLDTHVYIWSVAKIMRNIPIKNAGPGGVNGVLWVDGGKGGKLVSTGFDGVVRAWEVTFHA